MFSKTTLLPFLDVSYLPDETDQTELANLCQRIQQSSISPAGLCLYPRDIATAKTLLKNSTIPIISVINFPDGTREFKEVQEEIRGALNDGAAELDIVIPYQQYLQNRDLDDIGLFVQYCRKMDFNKVIKVILETGKLKAQDIYNLSYVCCEEGVNFIKTCTGKINPGATIEASEQINKAIKDYFFSHGKKVGIKIAGGIETLDHAQQFVLQLNKQLGEHWLTPNLFRIGASRLFTVLTNNAETTN